MNADQKERLLKLAETDPVLAHKVADFMNAGNAETNRETAPQEKIESANSEVSETKNLKWYDALLAKGILDNSVSSLGTVVLNNDNSGANNGSGQTEKLKITKEQLWWAKLCVGAIIFGLITVFTVILYGITSLANAKEPSTSIFFGGGALFITCVVCGFFASTKSEIPTIKTFISKNFTVQ